MTSTKKPRAPAEQAPGRERQARAAPAGVAPAERIRAARMSPTDRESQILDRAIEHFAAEGFSASTRELAQRLGVTHSLLYKYFPSKEALLDRVYERVYLDRLAVIPDDLLADRQLPIRTRLHRYYTAYAHAMLQGDWVRIFMFSGLKGAGISERLLALVRERIFLPVIAELQTELRVSSDIPPDELEMRVELVWGLHASIFYLGIRKWIFRTPVPQEIDALIEALVDVFYAGFAARVRAFQG